MGELVPTRLHGGFFMYDLQEWSYLISTTGIGTAFGRRVIMCCGHGRITKGVRKST